MTHSSVPRWRCSFSPFPTPESFAEQVSGVKLLDWGVRRGSVVEAGTEIFAGGYLGAGAA